MAYLIPAPQSFTGSGTIKTAGIVPVDTSGGILTLTLPSTIELGAVITVIDSAGAFGTNTCTVNCGGSDTFQNGTTTLGLDIPQGAWTFTKITSTKWMTGYTGQNSALGTFVYGNAGVFTTTATRYLDPFWQNANAGTANLQVVVPHAGYLSNLAVGHGTAGVGTNPIVYTVQINGANTALTVSMLPTASTGVDATDYVAVNAGDLVGVAVTKALAITSSPANITASFLLSG